MRKWKQGVYQIKNVNKYMGSGTSKTNTAIYRSSWERIVFEYLDLDESITLWGSEKYVIPYLYSIDNKLHRYFVDIYYETSSGLKYLIEIKPKSKLKRPTKNIKNITEYIQNHDKWKYAKQFADDKGMIFAIWTEDTVTSLKNQLIRCG
jgi:hypothetical protein